MRLKMTEDSRKEKDDPRVDQIAIHYSDETMKLQIIRLQEFIKANYPASFDEVSGINLTSTHPTKFIASYGDRSGNIIHVPFLETANITDFLTDQTIAEDARHFLKHLNKKEIPLFFKQVIPEIDPDPQPDEDIGH